MISPAPAPEFKETGAVKVIAFVKERLALLVVTFPAKETEPPPVWLKVLPDEIVFPAVVVKVLLLAIVTGPVPLAVAFPKKVKAAPVREMPLAPLVEMLLLNRVVPVPEDWVIEVAVMSWVVQLLAEMTESPPSAVIAPALSENVMLPDPAVRDRSPGPSRSIKNEIALLEELRVLVPEMVTAPLKLMTPPAVMAFESWDVPIPSCVKLPAIEPVAAAANVAEPEFTREKGPAFVVVIVWLKLTTLPVMEMPAAPLVLRGPLNVAMPVLET